VTQEDDQQPPEQNGQPRISRDTLLLLGALTFLILAVALTFLFTPGAEELPPATEVAVQPTLGAEPTTPGYPAPGDTAEPGYPAPPEPAPGTPDEAYPGPDAPAGGVATPLPFPTVAEPSPADANGTPTDAYPAPTTPTTAPTQPVLSDDQSPYPQPDGSPPAQPTFQPTSVPPPVQQPPPATAAPPPTSAPPPPLPTPTPTFDAATDDSFDLDATPTPTTPGAPGGPALPPLPTLPPPPPPADVLRGNVRWATSQSPIILRRDVQVAPGAELLIEPGVEVRLDPGVAIYVDGGRLLALGLPNQPVRFIGATGARWDGLFGNPGSFVVLEHTEVRGGGLGGTTLAVDRGELVIRSSRFNDNGGAILLTDTRLEMLDSEVAGNDMPFGAALDAAYGRGGFVTMRNNRIAGNLLSDGAPMVRLANQSTFDTLNMELSGNLFRGGTPNLQVTTNGPIAGTVTCNAMVGDGLGLGLRTQTLQVGPNGAYTMNLRVESNFIDEHVPPIVPIYLRFGLGRGATSEIALDMRNNWWGDVSGPYEPETNPLGRGDSVGVNITYAPWLTAPPSCAPNR
jgi:hypothetical protein